MVPRVYIMILEVVLHYWVQSFFLYSLREKMAKKGSNSSQVRDSTQVGKKSAYQVARQKGKRIEGWG
jgi:hypothetical protein